MPAAAATKAETETHMKLDSVLLDAREYGVQASAVLGIKESGKSYTATCLAEQLHDCGVPFIAFDPMGIWRFMRVPGAHRGGRGYPIVVAGGVAGDLPLTPATAPAIVEAAMREGVSVVIDLFSMDLSKADWRRIVKDCAKLLLHKNRNHGLRHVFIEEAAEFVPQIVRDGDVFAEVEKLVRMGGNSRLGITLINPRSQEVNKAVLELCENLFLHRQRGKNAIENLDKWLSVAGAEESKTIIKSMPALPQGQCWAWIGGDTPIPPTLIKVPRKHSMHPDRRVMRGDEEAAPGKGAIDVGEFVSAMQSALPKLAAEAEASDPKLLLAANSRLKRELEQLTSKTAKGAGVSEAILQRARDEAFRLGATSRDEEIAELRASIFEGTIERMRAAIDDIAKRPPAMSKRAPSKAPSIVVTKPHSAESIAVYKAPPTAAPKVVPWDAPLNLTKQQLRVLEAIAFFSELGFEQPTRAQIGAGAGYSGTGGGLASLLSSLRTGGFVDYPAPNSVSFTEAGRAAAPAIDLSIPVRDRLAPILSMPQSKVLDALPRDGSPMSREAIGIATEYSGTGGGLASLLSSLKTMGFITYPQKNHAAVQPWVWS